MRLILFNLIVALILIPLLGNFAQEQPKKTFFLPKSPVAAAYVLNRLSNQELIDAPRSEFVYVALLQRKGLDKKYRIEALEGLAKLRTTDTLAELITGLADLDKKGEESAAVLRELSAFLLQFKSDELKAKRGPLEALSSESQLALTRQIGYAALVTADGSAEEVWRGAEAGEQQLADLLLAVPIIRDAKLRRDLYPKIETLLGKDDQPQVRRAAITAVAAVPDHEAVIFMKLADMVQAGTEQLAAIASLQRIPKRSWPKEQADTLLQSLMTMLEKVAVAERTQPDFVDAVQFATDLTSLLPAEKAKAINKVLGGLGVRVVVIRTVYEQMLYDKQRIVVEAGKPIQIVLDNTDAMPHNLVIVAPGAVEEIGLAAEKMPVEPDANGKLFVPSSAKVLYATKLLATGERDKLSFTAPEEIGDYGYVCTFPGHWRRMVGTMVVVKDVEVYLAAHPEPVTPQLTEWKVSDLASDLEKISFGRNLEAGKQLFSTLACAQCHKLGTAGYSFGPELTDVFKRWKGDRSAVLGEIIEPSKIIADRYRNHVFELKNGDHLSGMIAKEDGNSVTIHAGPTDSLIQTLKKDEIKSRHPQELSLMPAGLLSLMSKEQILDLLAFVESGGKVDSEHKH
jgi:putative heme-binding domain-containing protein